MSTEENIALLFTNPQVEPQLPGTFSILYLLRRDVNHCIGEGHTLWLGAMGILAGIDLLAKFVTGSDESGKVGNRFRAFIDRYFQPISSGDSEIIYQFRNALLHSFGLYSSSTKGEYHFAVLCIPFDTPLVQAQSPTNQYLVNLWTLYGKFEKAITCYWEDLKSDKALQANFDAMFEKYGTTGVGHVRVQS